MARPPRHRVELSGEERSELERIARAEKRPWREVQRARIVLYAAEGKSDVEIAARLDTSAGSRRSPASCPSLTAPRCRALAAPSFTAS
jgi:hypothetical protein